MVSMREIKQNVTETYSDRVYPEADIFVDYFKERFGDSLQAVILYGSCLSDSTRSDTSILDFYLIAEDYKTFHKKWIHAYINSLIPPALFYLELTDKAQNSRACKYNVISLDDLEAETTKKAKDFYHLGRFSKRLAFLYTQSKGVSERLVEVVTNSWFVLAPDALSTSSNDLTVEDFAKSLLSLSYKGEVRLENTEQKVKALYMAHKPFYDKALGGILSIWARQNRERFKTDEDLNAGHYLLRRTPASRSANNQALQKKLRRSRRRAKMRWPLQMFTVEGWVDILLAKLERTYGTRLELKPYERKFILIFGWKHYFRLRKQGKIR